MRAKPCASVWPLHTLLPRQSDTCTAAPGTGLPLSSEVTQAPELTGAHLKCTARFVTSTPVRTYIGALRSSSASPRRGDSISTT